MNWLIFASQVATVAWALWGHWRAHRMRVAARVAPANIHGHFGARTHAAILRGGNMANNSMQCRDGHLHNTTEEANGCHSGLGRQLVAILSEHCGERGHSEGAVDTLERIIRERDQAEASGRRQ